MRQAFLSEEHVTSKVVSRLYRDVYRDTDQVPLQISRAARQALLEGRLTTCGVCGTGKLLFGFFSDQNNFFTTKYGNKNT